MAGPIYQRVAAALLSLMIAPSAHASVQGVSGYSGNPDTGGKTCNKCHYGGVPPSVAIEGPAALVSGERGVYVVTIASHAAAPQWGGFNASAQYGDKKEPLKAQRRSQLGVFDANADKGTTLVKGGEVTHVAPRAPDSQGLVQFRFGWTAPRFTELNVPRSVTLYAAGAAVNYDFERSGDSSAVATFDVEVTTHADIFVIADPGGPYQGVVGEVLTLDGSGSSTVNATIVEYQWDIDYDSTGFVPEVIAGVPMSQYAYTAEGDYSVMLRVLDDAGRSATAGTTASIGVAPLAPVASIGGPYVGSVGEPLRLDGSASFDPDGFLTEYRWDLGFDTCILVFPSPCDGPLIELTPSQSGTYNVCLRVVDNDGLVSAPSCIEYTVVDKGSPLPAVDTDLPAAPRLE